MAKYLSRHLYYNFVIKLNAHNNFPKCVCSTMSSSNVQTEVDQIIIPKRIKRKPTDILYALSNTIETDYSAPHYKYHDDPYLTPASNITKRTFSLAKESGRRSARYFLNNYPELFYNDPAEPKIEAFSYKDVYDENTEFEEEDLKKCILFKQVNNCILIYNQLKSSNQNIADETLQDLLELLCFYNCEEPEVSDEHLEEKWFKQKLIEPKRLWINDSFAEILFNSMDKTSQSYCALIQGLTKFNQHERAFELYKEMKQNGFLCNTETYNSLIRIIPYLRESSESRWALAEEFLGSMRDEQIKPNLGTFNALLELVFKFHFWKGAKPLAKKIVVEMKTKLHIEPSLATYFHLLSIFCRDKGPSNTLLYEIMEEIKNKEFEARDPKDICFFNKAMEVCCNLADVQLAYKIHELLLKGNNYRLIGEAIRESIYFQRFFKLLCNYENIDVFMEIYTKYVPNVCTPDLSLLVEIIQTIGLNEAYHYIPQIWSDIGLFNLKTKNQILFPLLDVINKAKFNEDEKSVLLKSKFQEIVKEIQEFLENSKD